MSRSFDVLVVGAGPAGIAAATAAANCGRSVAVLDDNSAPGGQIWRGGIVTATTRKVDHRESQGKDKHIAAFRSSGVELLSGRRVVDAPQKGILQAVVEDESGERIEGYQWKRLIIATGARERFLPFPGWTLPGVFGAGGLQALVKGGLSVEGKRIVVAGSGPLLMAVAAHLQEYGATIVCIAEQAPLFQMLPFAASLLSSPSKLYQGFKYRKALAKVPYRFNSWPESAEGKNSVSAVKLTNGKRTWIEECDYLACGFHLVPNTELASLLGCELNQGHVKVNARQQTSVEHIYCAGEPTGIAGLNAALVAGQIAGLVAAGDRSSAEKLYRLRDRERIFGEHLSKAFRLRKELRTLARPDTIVCRCEDVSFSQLQSHSSWTDAKLQTRCGMGPCQGRICGAAVETLFGWTPGSVRPPIFPISIAAICNENAILTTKSEALQETQ